MDQFTLKKIQLLHPQLRDEAEKIYTEIYAALTRRASCRFTHTLRSFNEQDDLYAKGRTLTGKIVTNSKGGQSYHNYGLAIDICALIDSDNDGTNEKLSYETAIDFDRDGNADWMEIVDIFKKYGWQWGGDFIEFTDKTHFQKTFGLSIQECYGRHMLQAFLPDTKYIKLD